MIGRMVLPLPLLACLLLPAQASSQKPDPESLLQISNGTYLAFQAKDGKKMQALTTPDFTYVGSEGILSGQQLADATKDCVLRSFKLTQPTMKILSPTSTILTYIARQDESCAGKPVPSVLFNTDIFIRRTGKWLVSTHVEAAATDQGK